MNGCLFASPSFGINLPVNHPRSIALHHYFTLPLFSASHFHHHASPLSFLRCPRLYLIISASLRRMPLPCSRLGCKLWTLDLVSVLFRSPVCCLGMETAASLSQRRHRLVALYLLTGVVAPECTQQIPSLFHHRSVHCIQMPSHKVGMCSKKLLRAQILFFFFVFFLFLHCVTI